MFQFTHPGRGATSPDLSTYTSYVVSIHAPREGCDVTFSTSRLCVSGFNSRTPGGVRHARDIADTEYWLFQFTHPGRGATHLSGQWRERWKSFNSRTPGGVRRGKSVRASHPEVSIHAPREGCDWQFVKRNGFSLSVSIHAPREGCDDDTHTWRAGGEVSIHAPREGCDLGVISIQVGLSCFNSRTPGGVRRLVSQTLLSLLLFQFTHPGRGATGVP